MDGRMGASVVHSRRRRRSGRGDTGGLSMHGRLTCASICLTDSSCASICMRLRRAQ